MNNNHPPTFTALVHPFALEASMVPSQEEQMVSDEAVQRSIEALLISPSTCLTTSMNSILHVTAAELESIRYASVLYFVHGPDDNSPNFSAPKRNPLALHACS
jgi:hypothetical protein